MGIEIERFVERVEEDLLCSICTEVLENPVMINTCEHVYCEECINNWYSREQICPEDRKLIKKTQFQGITRYMRNQLNKLKIKCTHFEKGCQEICTYETIRKHESNCKFDAINSRRTKRIDPPLIDSINEKRVQKMDSNKVEIIRHSLPDKMAKVASKLVKEALYLHGHINYGGIASYIKQHLEPDSYKLWQCIVGNDFDCYTTADELYIVIKCDGLYIIAFKTK